jgi:hypothetical protein
MPLFATVFYASVYWILGGCYQNKRCYAPPSDPSEVVNEFHLIVGGCGRGGGPTSKRSCVVSCCSRAKSFGIDVYTRKFGVAPRRALGIQIVG